MDHGFWRDPTVRMLFDWPVGTLIGILLIVVCLFLICLIGLGFFHAVDSWFRPRKKGQGIVKEKTFTPEHEETTVAYNFILKTAMPETELLPDTWEIEVGIDGGSDSMEVEKEFFESVKKNDFVLVEYSKGRLSNKVYLKAIFGT